MRPYHRPLALALLVSFTPAVVPTAALAQASPAADPTIQAARARFNEGVAFFDKGEFENARAAFLQAYALHKHPAVLMNLAQSSLRSGHFLDADRYFARYMRESTSMTPAQRAEAEKGLADSRAKLGRLDITAPPGTAVTVDGDLAGTDGSTTFDVEPGTHAVKAGPESTSVTVTAGQTVAVKLGKGGPPPPAVAPAVPVEPATPPPTAPEPPAATPAAPPPSATEPSASGPGLFSPPETMTPVWVGLGVGGAGFLTAILFGVFKGSAQSSYDAEVNVIKAAVGPSSQGACVNPTPGSSLAGGCASLTSDGNAVNADATAANVGIAVGVVGVAFAAGWYLFAPKAAKAETKAAWAPRVEPIVGPRGGGLSLGGSF